MTVNGAQPNQPLAPPTERDQRQQALQTISSETVLRGQSAVEIEHNGQRYRLQATRQGKLILTK